MADFNFYFNNKERIELIDYILSKESKIIPDLEYTTKNFKVIQSLDDFIIGQKTDEHKYFIIDDSFTFEPIINNPNRFSKTPLYSIYQRKGGPYIDLSFYTDYTDDDTIPYKRSWLDHYARYIHYNSYEEFEAPKELKIYFENLITYIKTKCKTIKKNGKKYWISYAVLDEIKDKLVI